LKKKANLKKLKKIGNFNKKNLNNFLKKSFEFLNFQLNNFSLSASPVTLPQPLSTTQPTTGWQLQLMSQHCTIQWAELNEFSDFITSHKLPSIIWTSFGRST
jgi:hypothetical protein